MRNLTKIIACSLTLAATSLAMGSNTSFAGEFGPNPSFVYETGCEYGVQAAIEIHLLNIDGTADAQFAVEILRNGTVVKSFAETVLADQVAVVSFMALDDVHYQAVINSPPYIVNQTVEIFEDCVQESGTLVYSCAGGAPTLLYTIHSLDPSPYEFRFFDGHHETSFEWLGDWASGSDLMEGAAGTATLEVRNRETLLFQPLTPAVSYDADCEGGITNTSIPTDPELPVTGTGSLAITALALGLMGAGLVLVRSNRRQSNVH